MGRPPGGVHSALFSYTVRCGWHPLPLNHLSQNHNTIPGGRSSPTDPPLVVVAWCLARGGRRRILRCRWSSSPPGAGGGGGGGPGVGSAGACFLLVVVQSLRLACRFALDFVSVIVYNRGMMLSVVGFAGSRSLPSSFAPLVSSVVGAVLSAGRGVAAGCAVGADAFVLASVPAASASRLAIFAAFSSSGAGAFAPVSAASAVLAAAAAGASVRWLAGGPLSLPLRLRLASRSAALVRSLAVGGPGSGLVLFLASPAVPSGSLSAGALAAGFGVPVFAFACGFVGPPPLLAPGGLWSLVGGSSPFASAWRWSASSQLPLF